MDAITRKAQIEFENAILDNLPGRVFLLQDMQQRKDVIFQVFLEVYNSSDFQHMAKKSGGFELEDFFTKFLQYGVIDEFLNDPTVEDIMINSLDPVYIHRSKEGLIKTDHRFSSFEELNLFIKKLIYFSGRDKIQKINNVELLGIKGRANIVFSPFGPQITVTHAKEKPLSIIDLLREKTLTPEIAGLLWLYIEGLGVKPASLLIAGGPGAGKTTLMNALLSFIPSRERIVVIEDTFELNTTYEENCSRLESDLDISLADLVKNSLRMRPDRVIVGEVRGREAQDLMTAMNIGKYCMGTIHAATARETILRLQNEPMNIPEVMVNLLDIIIIMRSVILNGKVSRVVGEVVETAGMEQKQILLSFVWTCDLATLEFKQTGVSSVYRDKISRMSGKTAVEIIHEVAVRGRLLEYLLERNISEMKDVTRICRLYSSDPQKAFAELGVTEADLMNQSGASAAGQKSKFPFMKRNRKE